MMTPFKTAIFITLILVNIMASQFVFANTATAKKLTDNEKQWLADKVTLNIGTPSFEFPPYIIHTNDGKVLGIYNDYIELVAAELGLKINVNVFKDIAELEAAFKRGEIDLIVGFMATSKRKKFMAFSDIFMTVPRSILVKKSNEWQEQHNINDFEGLTFAIEKGFASRNELSSYLPEVKFFDVDGTNEAISAIKFNLAQAYYGDWITNNYILDKNTNKQLQIIALSDVKADSSRIGLQPTDPLLLSAINKTLATIDNATHAYIAARWNSSNLSEQRGRTPFVLSTAEHEWLALHPEIKFASSKYWYPYSFVNSEGVTQGLSAEVLFLIAQRLGIKATAVIVDTLSESLNKLANNEIDLLPWISTLRSDSAELNYSSHYHSSPWVAIIKSNRQLTMSQIRTEHIKVTNAKGAGSGSFVSKFLPNATVIQTQNLKQSFDLIAEGKADVVFCLLSSATPWLQGNMLGKYKIVSDISAEKNVNLHFAASKDEVMLITLINKALNDIGDQKLQQLGTKWSRIDIKQGIDTKELLITVLIVTAIVLLILSAILRWNRKLKREVQYRTDAEKRAKDAEFELNSLADAIPGAVIQFHINEHGKFVFSYISQGIEGLAPYKQSEIIAEPELFFGAIPQGDLKQLITAKKQSAKNSRAFEAEFRISFEQDKFTWLQITAFPQQMLKQKVWNGVLLDINERKEQEFALSAAKLAAEQAAKSKSQFLAMMSHEIRTPISGIIGLLELHSHTSLNKSQLTDVKTIGNSANNLLHILNDVLDHSKMEAGQLSVENIETDLLQLVEAAMQNHANVAQNKMITLNLDFDCNLRHQVTTDPVRLQQVLSNLISNAIKFTSKGEVLVKVSQEKSYKDQQEIKFLVKDTGIGISPSNQSKLFTPFTQAESSTSRKYGGTGLGLTICKMLVERLGGEIELSSEVGEGTSFSFVLTLDSDRTLFSPDLINTKPVILIDDGEFYCKKIKEYLLHWHYPLIVLPCLHKKIEKIMASLPRGECVFICHEQLISKYKLSEEFPSSIWIELSERNFSPAPQHLFLSSAPLLITQLLEVVVQTQTPEDSDLLDIIANDSLQDTFVTKEQAAENGQLILVAEDHPTNQMVIKRQLERLHFHADFVDDGEQALSAIMQQNYGLLLTDCHMPNMDGYQLTRTLREQGNIIPIIALTANALTGEAERCHNLGMNDYLTKPISLDMLKQTIDKHLQPDHDHSLSSIEYQQAQQAQQSQQVNLLEQLLDDTEESVQNELVTEMATLQEGASATPTDSLLNNDFLDFEQLIDMFGDMAIVKELLAEFISTTDSTIEQLRLCVLSDDFAEVGLLTHKIKGSAAMISAESLKNTCIKLEESAKELQRDETQQKFEQLTVEFSLFRQFSDENVFIEAM
ncbi:ATP-binding protein [Colwellia piezophila]|uniref:ATP-binding protein n=1 Tax=Colwellia piezophila TaxID=211668 RepID=UPI0003812356|nr:transporter substrate-binding domain-containing protein [Colwellia piezophila]